MDISPKIVEFLTQKAAAETSGGDVGAKAMYNNVITGELYDTFGFIPACVSHTKEYFRFWQGYGVKQSPVGQLKIWETDARYERHWDMWNEVMRYVHGVEPVSKFMAEGNTDHATDVIETRKEIGDERSAVGYELFDCPAGIGVEAQAVGVQLGYHLTFCFLA